MYCESKQTENENGDLDMGAEKILKVSRVSIKSFAKGLLKFFFFYQPHCEDKET